MAKNTDTTDLPNLAPERLKALEVLLGGGTIREAAKAANRSERAVKYWMRTVEFDAHMKDAQRATLSRCRLKLSVMADDAIAVLAEAMEPLEREHKKGDGKRSKASGKPRPMMIRLRGAEAVLEYIGLGSKKPEDADPIDEAKLEAMVRARGWVRREELEQAG